MLPWHKEKVVYVPITTTDTRPYIEKWQDKDYLRQVSGLSGNSIFKTEVIEALRALRDKADSAKTPEELQGYSEGIKAIKGLLTAPERAKVYLRRQEDAEYDEKEGISSR